MPDPEAVERTAEVLAAAESAVALTGAGASTASGIPAFRTDGGIWERFDPEAFTLGRFETEPGAFWADWVTLHEAVFEGAEVEPNPTHEALATLESRGYLDAVVTQNVDGLHQAAGSGDVVELHGSGDRVVCQSCRDRSPVGPAVQRARGGDLPPRCPECEGVLKPDSVLFGERLPDHARLRAHHLAETADAFLVVGSSLTVEPAASLPRTAADRGATLVVANREPTPLADRAAVTLRDDAEAVLPAVVTALDG